MLEVQLAANLAALFSFVSALLLTFGAFRR
jgi:hypothetical protein